MKTNIFLSITTASLLFSACGGDTPTTTNTTATTVTEAATTVTASTVTFSNSTKGKPVNIKGNVAGAAAKSRIFLDRKTADAHDVVTSVEINADGSFELKTGVEQTALYRLRVDVTPVYLVLNGDENLNVQATLKDNKLTNCVIEGSPISQELFDLSTKSQKEIIDYLSGSTAEKALVNYLLVEKLNIEDNLSLYQKVRDQLAAKYPNSPYANPFHVKVLQAESVQNAPVVKVGAKAPDIKLKGVDGTTEYKLSDLKGKVVLLDFWASWCGPCRKENPNVVRIYKKYKNQGFDVFSVSLDGLDDRTMTMLSDAARLNQAMDNERTRWKEAIAKDGLEWKYHVSELRKWNSQVATTYQISSIPRTFLIDRTGKIRYENLRGEQLELKLKELL